MLPRQRLKRFPARLGLSVTETVGMLGDTSKGGTVSKWMIVSVLMASIPLVVLADADDVFVARFEAGIGVDPVSGISSGTPPAPVSNVVRGVAPAGAPWHIGEFHARVRKDGHLFVEGRHLVLAGGSSLGQSLGVSVQAQLFCGASTPPTLASTTPLTTTTAAMLNGNGDFRFDEYLPSAPPDPCVDPVLLIVIPPSVAVTGAVSHWIAAGVPQLDLDDQ